MKKQYFFQFVTGCSKVPIDAFKSLPGMNGINKFKISKNFDNNYDRLPIAHNCFNQLDLPEYPNKEILKERLIKAIKEGKAGLDLSRINKNIIVQLKIKLKLLGY